MVRRARRGRAAAVGWALVVYGADRRGSADWALGLVARRAAHRRLRARARERRSARSGSSSARFRIIRDVFLEQAAARAAADGGAAGRAARDGRAGVRWSGAALRGADGRRGLADAARCGGRRWSSSLAALWAASAAVLAPAPPAPVAATRAAAPAGAPNVILIMVDTLRADHLSALRLRARPSTPHIDALAARRRPLRARLLAGVVDAAVGRDDPDRPLPVVARRGAQGRRAARPRRHARRGARSAAATTRSASPNNINVSPAFNFQQGFDEYHYLAPDFFFGADESAAQLTLYNGLRLVRERFLARRVDVHNYYQPAEVVTDDGARAGSTRRRRSTRRSSCSSTTWTRTIRTSCIRSTARATRASRTRTRRPRWPRSYRRLYDGEIALPRRARRARCSTTSKRRGLYDSTLIVLTADHGEEFHEHGGWWHGTTLYDEQIRVPLHREAAARRRARAASSTSWRRASTSRRRSSRRPGCRCRRRCRATRCRSTAAARRRATASSPRRTSRATSCRRCATRDVEADHRQPGQPARPRAGGALRRRRAIPASRRAWSRSEPARARGDARGARPVVPRGACARGRRRADRRRQRHAGAPAGARLRGLTPIAWARRCS